MKNRLHTMVGVLKTHSLLAAGFVLVAIVTGAFTAGPAMAQAVRAALVSNVDDPGRIAYQASSDCSSPQGVLICGTFPPVPAGKRLVITHVSGYFLTVDTTGLLKLPFLASTPDSQTSWFTTTYQGAGGTGGFFVFNQETLAYYDVGFSPKVGVLGVSGFAQFTLSGYLLDCSTGPCTAIAH